jgi:hypothetical protein
MTFKRFRELLGLDPLLRALDIVWCTNSFLAVDGNL